MLRDMVTVRVFDDRMYRAQRQGKTSFYMKCTGEEAIAVAAATALDRDDMHFPTYRQQGLLVARGYPLEDMMCQIYSNKGDKLQGPPAADHVFGQDARLLLDLGQSRHPIPAGGRLGDGLGDQGRQPDRMGWIGDGATAEGDFHSAMTFAAVYNVAGHPRGGQQPVGDLQLLRALPAPSARPSPSARSAMASPACASTAMTRWRSMPRCAGRPTARARTTGRR